MSNGALALFYLADLAFVVLAVQVYNSQFLNPLVRATGGLVNSTLLVSLAGMVLIVGGIIFGLGRLRPSDVGLHWSDVPQALAVLVLLWVAEQAVALVFTLASTGTIALDPLWTRYGVAPVLGLLLAQVFGNALFEEIGYRGFFLPQVHLRLSRVGGPRLRVVSALVVSQGLFALMHIPNRLWTGVNGIDLAVSLLVVFALGVLLALLYLRTGNLLLVVGVHALLNAPTMIVAIPISDGLAEALALVLLLVWPWAEKLSPRNHVRIAEARTG